MRLAILFVICFAVGAIGALIGRAALYHPYSEQAQADATTSAMTSMDSPVNPAENTSPSAKAQSPSHVDHGDKTPEPSHPSPDDAAPMTAATQAVKSTVNTVCPICGMDVDPAIESMTYQGKQVGLGCAKCPPKFKREPDRYGPAALDNRKAK